MKLINLINEPRYNPKTEQELLDAFIHARVKVIYEFSTHTRMECRFLERAAKAYALAHQLIAPSADSDYGIYYEDPEEDAIVERFLKRRA